MQLSGSNVLTPRITITGPVKAQLKRRFVESQHLQQNQTILSAQTPMRQTGEY